MSQTWDAGLYDAKHAFVTEHGRSLIDQLAPQLDERVLDLGCGTGDLTDAIAASWALAVGLDSSPEMLAAARAKYPNLEFVQGDAADFAFVEPFDAVFSNAALHWVPDAEGAVRSIAAALKPGGRFVAEFGGRGNIRAIIDGVRRAAAVVAGLDVWHRWYFPSVGEYAGLLERHGLEVRFAALLDRPTPLADADRGLRTWLTMFWADLLDAVPADGRDAVIGRAEELLRPNLFRDGTWVADYRRLRVVAVKVTG
ncbi:MAG TPA: methyltransferase domain-containing protein [Gemmataceae bacterium]|jgi:SAM-dependent methyltransferase